MKKLKNKTALITGGARGIGAAIGKLFVEHGANVVLTDLLATEGEKQAAEIGAVFFPHDVTSLENWEKVVRDSQEKFGTIDVLVNGAGILAFGTLLDADIETCRKTIDINLMGPFLGIRTVAPGMCKAKSGSIINISSAEALSAANGLNTYVASKWGVRGLSRSAALELGHLGVRVNTLCPGGINTPLANPSGATSEAMQPAFSRFPLQRIGEAEEVAAAALFLASDDSSYCCGAELSVDGGLSAGRYYAMLPGAPQRS